MRLISLNTWGGRLHVPLSEFLQEHEPTTDIFCFQEVSDNPPVQLAGNIEARHHFFSELQTALPDHHGYFAPQIPGIGLAVFVRKAIAVSDSGYSIALSTEEMSEKFIPRVLQRIVLEEPKLSIYNFHGVPKSDKRDTPERISQTARILDILAKDRNPKILVGDFNLQPETESLRAFENGMKNLVIEGGFKTTRSTLYDKVESQPFADYAFVAGVAVARFDVLQDEVSDHLPLLLDFE